jgi:predicted peroxiredoxin
MAYEKVLFYILTVPFFVRAEPATGELINPQAGAPFFLATAAASMDYEVEMVITSEAGFLLMRDNAKKVKVRPGVEQTVYDFIKMAKDAGVKIYLCVSMRSLPFNSFPLFPTFISLSLYAYKKNLIDFSEKAHMFMFINCRR